MVCEEDTVRSAGADDGDFEGALDGWMGIGSMRSSEAAGRDEGDVRRFYGFNVGVRTNCGCL